MIIDYKKELETAAKNMILVHDPSVLIKMVLRMIVQKLRVNHAGILLHDREKDTYILTVSRGTVGLKVPAGFARMDSDNPLIRFFRERQDKKFFNDGVLVLEEAKKILTQNIEQDARQLLERLLYQMEIFKAVVCIPSYFRDDLLGILILGNKRDEEEFLRDELDFFIALASDVAMAIRNALLFEELQLELERNKRLFINTTFALAAAIDAKDHYTHGHTTRVTNICLAIARKLIKKNKTIFDEKFLENLHIASLLHDIGKIGIPESILNKAGPLDDEERRLMQEHPSVGLTILEPIKELQDAILGVKYHHERYDGTGYPEGLKGEQIPLIASIIAVSDAFDAMTTDRPYRKRLSNEETIGEIKRQGGRQFDPQVVDALVKLYQENKL